MAADLARPAPPPRPPSGTPPLFATTPAFNVGVTLSLSLALALAPLHVLAAVGAAILAGSIALWPIVGLAAAAFAVPFGSSLALPIGPDGLTLTPLLLAWTASSIAVRMVVGLGRPARAATTAGAGAPYPRRAHRPARRRSETALWLGLAAYGVAHGASAWRATSLQAAIFESARWAEFGLAAAIAMWVLRRPGEASREPGAAARGLDVARKAPPSGSARWLTASLLAAGTAQAAFALWMAWRGIGPEAFGILGGHLIRAHGTFGQPNPFGAYMNLVWPLGAALVFEFCLDRPSAAEPTPHRSRLGVPWPLAVGGAVALGVCGAALALSWSRGAWLAGGAAGAAMAAVWLGGVVRLPRRPSTGRAVRAVGGARPSGRGTLPDLWPRPPGHTVRPARLPTLGAVYLLAVTLTGAAVFDAPIRIPASIAERAASISAGPSAFDIEEAEVDDANFATIERLAHWEAARSMWAAAPWLGQGPGHYELVYGDHRLPRWSAPLGHAHNYYLHALAETGITGLTGYLAFLAGLAAVALRAALRANSPLERALGLGLVGALASASVHSIFDNVWVHEMTVHVGLMAGLAAGARGRG